MKKFGLLFIGLAAVIVAACDLQPKILSLPDTVGEFISARYPALLADPETQPEIYNSAATDYGVYASPTLYGSVGTDEYVEYASVNDYIVPPTATEMYGDVPDSADTGAPILMAGAVDSNDNEYLRVPMYGGVKTVHTSTEITVAPGDTLYSLAKKYNTSVDELARANNLDTPYTLSVGQKLKVVGASDTQSVQTVAVPVAAQTNTTTRVKLRDIQVVAGDTLYSLSRKYSVPVNDLAVMNNLSAPFTLSVGQTLKVPDLDDAPVRASTTVKTTTSQTISPAKSKEKISSDPTQNCQQSVHVHHQNSRGRFVGKYYLIMVQNQTDCLMMV